MISNVKLFFINLLTFSRIGAAVSVFFAFSDLTLLLISVWAALSDFFDGYLARRFNVTTKAGAVMDQMADKIFHLLLFLYLLKTNSVHLYFVVLFILREAAIIILRNTNSSIKTSNFFGKLKTVFSYCLIIYLFGRKIFFSEVLLFDALILHLFEISILTIAYYSLLISIRKKKATNSTN